ncbi:hypothetical protein ACFXKR_36985 [Streptomyces violascens]|uniref:hypothetical protein n=1 Tax=Streptomyces violascens TaxID=67381 RepID=UPI00367922F3
MDLTPREFASPRTQLLLAHTGTTTHLLQHLLRASLQARVLTCIRAPAGSHPPAAALLELAADEQMALRRSLLLLPCGTPASANLVLGAVDRHPWTAPLLENPQQPLGILLANTRHPRIPLGCGLSTWNIDESGRPAAAKCYRILDQDRGTPALCIYEQFNPGLIDPTLSGEAL